MPTTTGVWDLLNSPDVQQALRTPPARVTAQPRYVRTYWVLDPAEVPDAEGCVKHVTLTIEHTDKAYRATLSTAIAAFPPDGTHRELITARPDFRTLIARESAPRFSATKFQAFASAVQSTITSL